MDQFADQFEELQDKNRKIFIKLAVVGSIIFGLSALAGGGFLYLANSISKNISNADAQKIGNWAMPDSDYSLDAAYEIKISKPSKKFLEISDKKSGNNFWVIESELDRSVFLKSDGIVDESNFADYGIKNYQMVKTGTNIIDEGLVSYNLAKWTSSSFDFPSVGASEGFFSRIDCVKNNKSIKILAANEIGKYNHERALEFINSFKCRKGAQGAFGIEKKAKLSSIINKNTDYDSDGLPDAVEKVLMTNHKNIDTDSDGFNDLEEIKNGYNPLVDGALGKMSTEELEIMKEKIRNADIEFYNKNF